MAGRMTSEHAQTLALKVVAFLVDSPDARERLLELSGLDAASLRERAEEPDVLVAFLDFLLSNEGLLVDFCHAESTDARAVHMARHLLGGE